MIDGGCLLHHFQPINTGALPCHLPRLPYVSPHEIRHRLIEELDRALECRRAEVPDHAQFSQRSRSSTSRCFQGYCMAISPARQPNTEFSAAGAAW